MKGFLFPTFSVKWAAQRNDTHSKICITLHKAILTLQAPRRGRLNSSGVSHGQQQLHWSSAEVETLKPGKAQGMRGQKEWLLWIFVYLNYRHLRGEWNKQTSSALHECFQQNYCFLFHSFLTQVVFRKNLLKLAELPSPAAETTTSWNISWTQGLAFNKQGMQIMIFVSVLLL